MSTFPDTSSALSIRHLTQTHVNVFPAFNGIDLDLPEGDFFALLAPNGQ
ncbi:ABC transporter ATP-binding protein, partial [Pseudomonas syringae]|nr:ABC transporter ATP-binding protein [Pseudomonas syringae]